MRHHHLSVSLAVTTDHYRRANDRLERSLRGSQYTPATGAYEAHRRHNETIAPRSDNGQSH
jgi:hypothetical protein